MSHYSTAEEEYQFILEALNNCLSQLIDENHFKHRYRIKLEQQDLMVKEYVDEILEGIDFG